MAFHPASAGRYLILQRKLDMASQGFFNAFDDVWLVDGKRTPMVDYCGALGHISPTDLGIKAARAATWRPAISNNSCCLATSACMPVCRSPCQR
jgi:hypothetical protein